MSNQSVRKCSRILHQESKEFVGTAKNGYPYSSDRDLIDDALRKHLQTLKQEYPKFVKSTKEKKQ